MTFNCYKGCPTVKSEDCTDLKRLAPFMLDDHINASGGLDDCSPSFCSDILQWAVRQAQNTSCVVKNLVNQICNLWTTTRNLERTDNYLQCQIDELKEVILGLVTGNIATIGSYQVMEETPKLSVVVNKDGTFRYEWSDWDTGTSPWSEFGHGVLTGRLNFTMTTNDDGGLHYQINSVYLGTVTYTATGYDAPTVPENPTYAIRIPSANSAVVWSRVGTVRQSWSESINQTVPYSVSGNIAPNSESANIPFLNWGADWAVDDRVQLNFKFINNNETIAIGECEREEDEPIVDTLC